jgi:hypothetical protein
LKSDPDIPCSLAHPSRLYLDRLAGTVDNNAMEIRGHVKNGVVVLDDGASLPEGTPVTVSCVTVRIWRKPGKKTRIRLPLVRSNHPGSVNLTNERIAEILDEEDVARYRDSFGIQER